jgi:hypothetical protein
METKTYNYKYNELNIESKSLVLAMGYASKPAPSHIYEEIERVLEQGKNICEIKGGYNIFYDVKWNKEDYSLFIKNSRLKIERIIFQQIRKSTSVAVFACTAGQKISDLSKQFMKDGDLLKGYVYDVFGSVVVERAMDRVQESLKQKMLKSGLKITNRFSPGYCGWDVAEQQNLFSLLPEDFCGIELTESSLMKPIKSVSGIIGIGESVKFDPYTCDLCDMENCLYRNLGQEKTN